MYFLFFIACSYPEKNTHYFQCSFCHLSVLSLFSVLCLTLPFYLKQNVIFWSFLIGRCCCCCCFFFFWFLFSFPLFLDVITFQGTVIPCKWLWGSFTLKQLTFHYLMNVNGSLLFSKRIFRVNALIRWQTPINVLAKFQGGRLFQCGGLLDPS